MTELKMPTTAFSKDGASALKERFSSSAASCAEQAGLRRQNVTVSSYVHKTMLFTTTSQHRAQHHEYICHAFRNYLLSEG